MDQFYDRERAKEKIGEALLVSEPRNLQLQRFQSDEGLERQCGLTSTNQNKVWKLTRTDAHGIKEEVVLRVQGVLCNKHLPPITRPFTVETRTRPYIKQSVSLTAFGTDTFQDAVESIAEIHRLFSRNFPQGVLEGWVPGQFDTFLTIDAANRFYTHRSLANTTEVIPFSAEVDPQEILKRGITEKYVHTTENVVEYYEKMTGGSERPRYITINPVKFQCGDIVEAQLSFQTVALKEGKHKMLVVLRALTLLDELLTKDANIARNRCTQQEIVISLRPIKRKVGYEDDGMVNTEERMSRMRIDDEAAM